MYRGCSAFALGTKLNTHGFKSCYPYPQLLVIVWKVTGDQLKPIQVKHTYTMSNFPLEKVTTRMIPLNIYSPEDLQKFHHKNPYIQQYKMLHVLMLSGISHWLVSTEK
jgi:hypothetical protein